MNWLEASSRWRKWTDRNDPCRVLAYFDSLIEDDITWLNHNRIIDIHTACAHDIDKMFWTMEKEWFLSGHIITWRNTSYITQLNTNITERLSRKYSTHKIKNDFQFIRHSYICWNISFEILSFSEVILHEIDREFNSIRELCDDNLSSVFLYLNGQNFCMEAKFCIEIPDGAL